MVDSPLSVEVALENNQAESQHLALQIQQLQEKLKRNQEIRKLQEQLQQLQAPQPTTTATRQSRRQQSGRSDSGRQVRISSKKPTLSRDESTLTFQQQRLGDPTTRKQLKQESLPLQPTQEYQAVEEPPPLELPEESLLSAIKKITPGLLEHQAQNTNLTPFEKTKQLWSSAASFTNHQVKTTKKIYRTEPRAESEPATVYELFEQTPGPEESVFWCFSDDSCNLVLQFNWAELEPVLKRETPTWPQNVLDKVKDSEVKELKTYFQRETIDEDVATVLRLYPQSKDAVVSSPDVFTRLMQRIIPSVVEKFQPDSYSNWITSGVKWMAQKTIHATSWVLRNPLWATLLNIVSKVVRLAVCLYFAKITQEEFEKLVKYLFASLSSSNPLFVVAATVVSCLWDVIINFFTGNLAGIGKAISDCVVNVVEKVANLGGVVKMFSNLVVGLLQYVADLVQNIPLVGPLVSGGVKIAQVLLMCSGSPWDCLKSFVSKDAVEKLSVDLVVAKHMGLQLGMFGLLLVMSVFGTALDGIIVTFVPLLRPVLDWLHTKGLGFFQLATYATKLLTQGVSSIFTVLVTTLAEIRGWVEVLWGCGFKRFIQAIRKIFGLVSPSAGSLADVPEDETEISCCMGNIVAELRMAVNATSFLKAGVVNAVSTVKDGVVKAASGVWNWLPCDQRHKVLLFSVPVATVRYKRKRVNFYAFVWKPEAPYSCDQQVHVAPLAQKFKKQFPSAVRYHPQGHGLLINIQRCPRVVQRAFSYLSCPVITLDGTCPLELKELTGHSTLFG